MAWDTIVKQPNISGTAPFLGLSAMNQGFQNLGQSFNQLGGIIEKRARNNAMRELFEFSKGLDYQDPMRATEATQSKIGQLFTGDAQLSPMEQIGLSRAITEPLYAERGYQTGREDTRFNQGLNTLKTLGNLSAKTVTQPKTGETRGYNPYTGTYDRDIYEGIDSGATTADGGSINSKDIVLKEITYKDGSGNTIKKQVPVNKTTGNIVQKDAQGNLIDTGKQAVTSERKTISQADKDSATAFKTAQDNISQIEKLYTPDIVGPVDNALSWIANTTGTAQRGGDAERNYQLNQEIQNLKANLTAALIKGVPSDRDLQMIEDMLPSTGDSQEVFKAKLGRIKNILSRQQDIARDQAGMQGQEKYYDQESVSNSGKPIVKINGKWYYK
jgi:hypothetical protein